LPQLTNLWQGPLSQLDHGIDHFVETPEPVGFPPDQRPAAEGPAAEAESQDLGADARATLLAVYAGQFGSYVTLLWQVPALSLTAQAFLFTIALAKDVDPGARVVLGVLSVVTSLMSIYLMFSHRVHAERQGLVAMDLAQQLGARPGQKKNRGAVEVWAGVNRGSFALWIVGLSLFGMVGLGAAILGLSQL
jgi:hypothetical protein